VHRQKKLTLVPAFVIHQRAFRETSLLLEVFTSEFGRLGLVARGAKRAKSPLRHNLQAFQPLLIRWSGRGDLGTLTHVEQSEITEMISGKAVLSGLYLNELIMRLTHRHDPQAELFNAYASCVASLRAHADIESSLRVFEKRLLEATGYGLILDHEISTGMLIDSQQQYIYDIEQGPLLACKNPPAGIAVSGDTLLALAREDIKFSSQGQKEAKHLMRAVLKRYLGERQLQSRNLFQPIAEPHL